MEDIIQRVRNLPATPTTISPTTFADEDEAEQMASTSTDRDRIASLNAESMLAVRGGERFQLALPAYEKFTTDGTGGNTETFSLSHSVMQTPNTENIVVWERVRSISATSRSSTPWTTTLTPSTTLTTAPATPCTSTTSAMRPLI